MMYILVKIHVMTKFKLTKMTLVWTWLTTNETAGGVLKKNHPSSTWFKGAKKDIASVRRAYSV